MVSIRQCASSIRQGLSEVVLNSLARESGYCRKLRKLTPLRTALTVISGLGSGTTKSVADLRRTFTDISGETIGYKPFHDRLSSPGFPEFMRMLLIHFMETLTPPAMKLPKRFHQFDDIIAHDATAYRLNDRLKDIFPGIHTKQAPAAAAIHCSYSLLRGQCQSVGIAGYSESEITFLPDPESLQDKLLLLDAGFNKTSYFGQVDRAGGYFICRAGAGLHNPKLTRCESGIRTGYRVEGKRLKDLKLPNQNLDFDVVLHGSGIGKYETRLVCIHVKNVERFNRKRGKSKQRPKTRHICLYTNLPRSYSAKDVGDLYRLRWQVELFFKECKSHTCLQKFQTADPRIVEGLIWGSMLAVLFRRFILHHTFVGTGKRGAEFVAAKMSWTFMRDLTKAVLMTRRTFHRRLSSIFETLRALAPRTNPHRRTGWEEVGICPA